MWRKAEAVPATPTSIDHVQDMCDNRLSRCPLLTLRRQPHRKICNGRVSRVEREITVLRYYIHFACA